MPRTEATLLISAALAAGSLSLNLAAGDAQAGMLTVLLVAGSALLAIGLTTHLAWPSAPLWLPALLGIVALLASILGTDSRSGFLDGLHAISLSFWIGAGLLRWRSISQLLPEGYPASGGGRTGPLCGLILRRMPSRASGLVLAGAALCLVSIFMQWQPDRTTVNQSWSLKGTITTYRDERGIVVGTHDGTYLSPDFTSNTIKGVTGVDATATYVPILLVLYLFSGLVRLAVNLPWWTRYLPALGIAWLAWAAFDGAAEYGVRLAILLFVAGLVLLSLGGRLSGWAILAAGRRQSVGGVSQSTS